VNLHFSLIWIKQRKVSSHPPSTICLFPISPSLSLPLLTLRLVSLVSLIAKTKRIAERSATNCDTHTHTHRQSTLGKYMIKLSSFHNINTSNFFITILSAYEQHYHHYLHHCVHDVHHSFVSSFFYIIIMTIII
jgi:hypothetical protein